MRLLKGSWEADLIRFRAIISKIFWQSLSKASNGRFANQKTTKKY